MNGVNVQEIVDAVLKELNVSVPASGAEGLNSSFCPDNQQNISESGLPDIASDEIKKLIGVKKPKNADVLREIRKNTAARIAVGNVGPRPRTKHWLRFLADHSLSRDTVFKDVSKEWIEKNNMFLVRSQVENKDQYLTRPDLGRILSEDAKKTMLEKCKKQPTVQIVISDGLSTDAPTANYEEILPALVQGFKNSGIDVGEPFFVQYGRVKIEDEIGELLGAEVVILLIGERPGLGQSESMSAYIIYKPSKDKTVESDRTVISNIHRFGTPPVEASAVIVDMVKRMLKQKTSGINLKN